MNKKLWCSKLCDRWKLLTSWVNITARQHSPNKSIWWADTSKKWNQMSTDSSNNGMSCGRRSGKRPSNRFKRSDASTFYLEVIVQRLIRSTVTYYLNLQWLARSSNPQKPAKNETVIHQFLGVDSQPLLKLSVTDCQKIELERLSDTGEIKYLFN